MFSIVLCVSVTPPLIWQSRSIPFPCPFPAPEVMLNPSIVRFWLVPVIVNPGTETVWPGVAATVTPGEAGAIPLNVIADQLPGFKHTTDPGEAAATAL